MTRRRGPIAIGAGVAAGVLAATLAVLLLRPDPVLIDPADLPDVVSSHQGERAWPPGWTWCDLSVARWVRQGDPVSTFTFSDDTLAAAVIADGRPRWTTEEIASTLDDAATRCAGSDKPAQGYSIEPLNGLDDGELGWRTSTPDGDWGEYVVIPLDDVRVLTVGFSTWEDDPPVTIEELVAHAKEGAEQFPAPSESRR